MPILELVPVAGPAGGQSARVLTTWDGVQPKNVPYDPTLRPNTTFIPFSDPRIQNNYTLTQPQQVLGRGLRWSLRLSRTDTAHTDLRKYACGMLTWVLRLCADPLGPGERHADHCPVGNPQQYCKYLDSATS